MMFPGKTARGLDIKIQARTPLAETLSSTLVVCSILKTPALDKTLVSDYIATCGNFRNTSYTLN